MATISYTGLKDFNEFEQAKIRKILETDATKLDKRFRELSIGVVCRKYSSTGNRHKYSIHARVSRGSFLVASHAFDWELERACHKVMNKLLAEYKHRLKVEGKKVRASQINVLRKKAR